jgi:hypothetical protein
MTGNTRREFLVATAGVWVGSAAGLGQERSPNAKLNIGVSAEMVARMCCASELWRASA